MEIPLNMRHKPSTVRVAFHFMAASLLASLVVLFFAGTLAGQSGMPPSPLLDPKTKVDWWFIFKFNAWAFPRSCTGTQRACPFGGTVQPYLQFSQEFAYASSADHVLQQS